MPIHCDWRLNEQMYGALQGLNKRATAERYGEELTQRWRRSCELVRVCLYYKRESERGGIKYRPKEIWSLVSMDRLTHCSGTFSERGR